MASINKVMLIGRLGKDPELKYSQNGSAICTFSLATSEQWTDKNTGEKQERTEWSRIVVFGKAAETCEKYLTKGSQIYLEGRLQTRQWEREGQQHYTTEIVVSNFQFLGGNRQDGAGHGQHGQNRQAGQGQTNQNGQNQQNHSGQYGPNNPTIGDNIPF